MDTRLDVVFLPHYYHSSSATSCRTHTFSSYLRSCTLPPVVVHHSHPKCFPSSSAQTRARSICSGVYGKGAPRYAHCAQTISSSLPEALYS